MRSSIFAPLALAATVAASPLAVRQESSGLTFDTNTSEGDELAAFKTKVAAAVSYSDRQTVLFPNPPDASNAVMNFVNNTVVGNTGGTIALATRNNFPALIGTNVAQAVGWVNACGLNVPHSHPRSNEMLTVIQGELVAGLILEKNNGNFGDIEGETPTVSSNLPLVNTTLSTYQGFLFPQGQAHFQFNPTCEPAAFTAAFDSSDPGRTQVARNFFSNLPDTVLQASLGDPESIEATELAAIRNHIPTSYAVLIEECAKRCGL